MKGRLTPELKAAWDAVVSRDTVAAAFQTNLKSLGGSVSPDLGRAVSWQLQSAPSRSPAKGQFQPVEMTALGIEDLTAFKSNLTGAIQVALTPTLSVTPQSLNLFTTVDAAPTQHLFQIGSLGGTVNWSAEVSLLNGNGGLAVLPAIGTATVSRSSTVTLNVNYASLGGPDLYQALLSISDTDTGYKASVPLAIVLRSTPGRLLLSQSSIVFNLADGDAAPAPQALNVINGGQGSFAWSIPSDVLPNWLTVSPASGIAVAGSSQPSLATFGINATNAQALAKGVYQVLIPVSAPNASNSPQLVSVTLERMPGNAPAVPSLSSNGFIFVEIGRASCRERV